MVKKQPDAQKANWVADPGVEKRMADCGVTFKIVRDLAVADIDWQSSLDNMARLRKAVNTDTVADYGLMQLDGDRFPMPVSRRDDKDRYLIVAGVHRMFGTKEAGFALFDGYVAEFPTLFSQERVAVGDNRDQGERLSRAEAIQFAVRWVEESSTTAEAAASDLKLPADAVRKAVKVYRLRKKLDALGVPAERLSERAVRELAVFKDADVLVAMAKSVLRKDGRFEDFMDLKRQVQGLDTSRKKLNLIKRWNEEQQEIAPQVRGPHKLDVRTKFLRAFHQMDGLLKGKTSLRQLQIEPGSDEAAREKKRWQAMKRKMDRLCK